MIALTAHVDSVKMLTAICDRCGEEALYTYCKPSADYAVFYIFLDFFFFFNTKIKI